MAERGTPVLHFHDGRALLPPRPAPHMTQRPSARSPRYALGVALVLLGALLTPLQPAAAAGKPTRSLRPEERRIRELEAQRSKVRASKAKAAARVDALKATDEQIQSALDDLSDHVTSTTARLEDARRAAESAEADLAAATAAQAEAEVQLGALRDRIRTQAVEVFVSGGREDSWSIYSAQTATDATNRKTLLEYRATLNLDSLEDFRTIQENLAIARLRAANASERAKRHRGAVSRRLDSLKAAEAEQEKFAAQVDDRIEASLAEADSLAGIDKGLSDQIVSQQGALAKRVAAVRKKGGSTSGGSARTFATSGGAGISTVQGIRVASSLASQLDALLNAARAAGIELSGGGYRDPSGQIAVRRSNCGSSNYAIYHAPASSCSPPTARPGQSMHEQGLAIDFTSGGRTLSRGSAGYAWLKANAGSYGLQNLPSEPWHWSTNGN